MRALGPALLGLIVLPAAAGCGDGFAQVEPDNPTRVAEGLVFTRADGTSYEVDRAVARCDRTALGADYLLMTATSGDTGPRVTVRVTSGLSGVWPLPLGTRASSAATRDVDVRASDPATGTWFSGLRERASGEVIITEATCSPEPRLAVRIHATLQDRAHRPLAVDGGLASLQGE